MRASSQPRILYVDNDSTSCEFVRAWLGRNAPGCRVVCVNNGREALQFPREESFDLYIFEYCLDEMTGPELCREVRHADPSATVVICSSLGREVDRDMALSAGATEYLVKPEEFYRLATTIRRHIGTMPRTRNRLVRSLARSAAII